MGGREGETRPHGLLSGTPKGQRRQWIFGDSAENDVNFKLRIRKSIKNEGRETVGKNRRQWSGKKNCKRPWGEVRNLKKSHGILFRGGTR